ncbi:transposase [Alteromonas gracilis]|uniref:transposase n=1 Tax=Alteromonas gracilis TaxID=1479524 RepID=UPI0037355FD5
MARSRKSLISLTDTPYYHCISRCVRRSFLCGYDRNTQVSYEHRKSWVEERLLFLGQVFAIDICAYAVMSNHVHVVLCVNKESALSWPLKTVLSQWHKMHKGTLLTQKYLKGELVSESELKTIKSTAEVYRKRLYDISWFMRNLNEYIARKANEEDECTGRFWGGRFRSQALLTEKALISCMAYVDLNPIRAKVAKGLGDSLYTSINRRLSKTPHTKRTKGLMSFRDNIQSKQRRGINFTLKAYCALLRSSIEVLDTKESQSVADAKAIELKLLNINKEQWLQVISNFESAFSFAVGDTKSMLMFKQHTSRKRIAKLKTTALCFNS